MSERIMSLHESKSRKRRMREILRRWKVILRERHEIWLHMVMLVSKITPRLRTFSDGSMVSLPTWSLTAGIWFLICDEAATKNSVFSRLSCNILHIIQDCISLIHRASEESAWSMEDWEDGSKLVYICYQRPRFSKRSGNCSYSSFRFVFIFHQSAMELILITKNGKRWRKCKAGMRIEIIVLPRKFRLI